MAITFDHVLLFFLTIVKIISYPDVELIGNLRFKHYIVCIAGCKHNMMIWQDICILIFQV